MMMAALLGEPTVSAARTQPAVSEPCDLRFWGTGDEVPVSFRRHVIPLASRLGCSSRECHGSFQGQGELRLSLFGYDFEMDHQALTAENDERIDRKHPENSLILKKATLQEKHRGKKRMDVGSWEYNVFLNWIKSGAHNDAETSGDFLKLEILPSQIQFLRSGELVELKVLAHWDNGDVEDVTGMTRFQTNDESVATVDKRGVVTAVGSGDTHIVAFYDNGVAPVEVLIPWQSELAGKYPALRTRTEIDRLVLAKLSRLGIVPSEVCGDEDFLRRVRLDLTGTLPTPDEVMRFLHDPSPGKRQAKIELLLKTPEYAAWWATRLCDFTGNNNQQMPDRNFRNEFSSQWWEWIHQRITQNVPYNQIVRGIMLASSRSSPQESFEDYATEMSGYLQKNEPGSFADRPSMPHFWARRNVRTADEKALSISHAFLGVRIECAQCHKHPFDQWTQQDFSQFKDFFEPVRFGRNPADNSKRTGKTYASILAEIEESTGYDRKMGTNRKAFDEEIKRRVAMGEPVPWQEVFVDQRFSGSPNLKNPNQKRRLNTRVLTPKLLGGEAVMVATYSDPREPLMDWMEDRENPYFSRAFVNRVWAHYFHRGLVEPADDMNLANPSVNEPLLDYLAEGFIESGFDMKWLHREILTSDTYQRSWRPNDSNRYDERNFSRMILRRLPAEVVHDAIQQATAPSSEISHMPSKIDGRAIGVKSSILSANTRNGLGYALNVFGKPERLNNCDCERSNQPTLLQTIYTRNDPDVLTAVTGKEGRTYRWADEIREQLRSSAPAQNKRADRKSMQSELQKVRLAYQDHTKNKPVPPEDLDPAAQQRYRKSMRQYQNQLQALKEERDNLISRLESPSADSPTSQNQVALEKAINEVFLRTLSRLPLSHEFQNAMHDIHSAPNAADALSELLWALLNTKEFLVNH